MRAVVLLLLLAGIGCDTSGGPADSGATPDASTSTGRDAGDSGSQPDAAAPDAGDSGAAALARCGEDADIPQLRSLAPADAPRLSDILNAGPGSEPSGLRKCLTSHLVHRARAVDCLDPLWVNPSAHCDGFGPDFPEVCSTLDGDAGADCSGNACYERFGCTSDDDCAEDDELCVCASGLPLDPVHDPGAYEGVQPLSRCVPAGCRTDADCGGAPCGAIVSPCRGEIVGFQCFGEGDECRGEIDCDGGLCGFDYAQSRWTCMEWATCE